MQPIVYLDLSLHILDGVAGLNLEGDSFAREGLDEDLHGAVDAPYAVGDNKVKNFVSAA